MRRSLVANVFRLAFGVVALATVIGLVTLWPEQRKVEQTTSYTAPETETAKILGVRTVPCTTPGAKFCVRVSIRLESGPDKGKTSSFGFAGRDVRFAAGDRIQVYKQQLQEIEDEAARGLLAGAEANAARIEVSRRILAAAEEAEARGLQPRYRQFQFRGACVPQHARPCH